MQRYSQTPRAASRAASGEARVFRSSAKISRPSWCAWEWHVGCRNCSNLSRSSGLADGGSDFGRPCAVVACCLRQPASLRA